MCKTNFKSIYGKKEIPSLTFSRRNFNIIKDLDMETFKITKNKVGKYYIIMTKFVKSKENYSNRKHIVSLDPGVKNISNFSLIMYKMYK